jgi:hypothetical protein
MQSVANFFLSIILVLKIEIGAFLDAFVTFTVRPGCVVPSITKLLVRVDKDVVTTMVL